MPLEQDIQAYEQKQAELENRYTGKFVVFHGGQMGGVYDDFDSAAKAATQQFANDPFLIRRVGEDERRRMSISVIRSR